MNNHVIFGVHVTDRLQHASAVQALFTEYGRHIRTRVGLHDVSGDLCQPGGVVLLDLVGDEAKLAEFYEKLGQIEGIEVQKLVFTHTH